ncbi:MAG: radical SAM protein [Nitrospirae bacterium]|nr:radical SAM protein [Nitrospirota bacterium]MCL5238252.1 radical SAM protein [Nitrospirota bacterium]
MNRKLVEKVKALLSKEKGTIFKDPGGRISICLVYPNTYHVGMSNLGFQGIYGLLNKRDDVVCERAFLPDDSDIEVYRRTNTPVFSIESGRPIDRFDIVAFSVSFENDYPNILKILDLAKIPPIPSKRNEYHPLLIAGGVCLSFNPEPIAPAFDVVFVGEAEESLNEFLDMYRDRLKIPLNPPLLKGDVREITFKNEIKREAVYLEGVYVPEFYSIRYDADGKIIERVAENNAPDVIKRRYLKDLSASPITTAIVTPESEFSGMYLIEAMRGCPWNCRFCLVGHIYDPPRKKSLESIRAEIASAKKVASRIGVVGPSLTDYPHIKDILCIDDVAFSITSLRASEKSAELVGLLKGHKSVSIAPEAGTERMRKIINKRITGKDILDTAKLILDAGIENLRLYFMIGLPAETTEDIAGIVELVKKVRGLAVRSSIILSISAFVPKPFTPFQWRSMEPLDSVKEKLHFIKKALRNLKGVKVFHDVPKYARMQGMFSVGDRRIFSVLELMADTDDWGKACSAAGVDRDFYIFRNKDFGELLPWDFIDTGISKQKLWDEYTGALSL